LGYPYYFFLLGVGKWGSGEVGKWGSGKWEVGCGEKGRKKLITDN